MSSTRTMTRRTLMPKSKARQSPDTMYSRQLRSGAHSYGDVLVGLELGLTYHMSSLNNHK